MRNVKPVVLLALALAAALAAPAAPAPAAPAPAAPAMKVIGRSLATVYVDGGRGRGLKVGDRVRVVKGQTTVAEMMIVSINEHSAACRVVSLKRPIAKGDTVVPVVPASTPRTARATAAKAETGKPAAVPKPPVTSATRARPPSAPRADGSRSFGQPAAAVSNGVPTVASPAAETPPSAPPAKRILTISKTADAPAPSRVKTLAASASTPPGVPAKSGAPTLEAPATKGPPPAPKPAAPSGTPDAPAPGFASLRPQAAPSGPRAATVPVAKASATPTPAVAARTAPPAPVSGRGFKVRYRSAANAYLAAGRAEGLEVGDRLRVVAGTTTVAELEVVYVAELSASCKVLSETRPIGEGDVARFVAGAAGRRAKGDGDGEPASETTARVAPASPAPVSSPAPTPDVRWARLRGAASLGYYRSWDNTESALDYQQRTARLALGLYDIAGQPLSFSVRARTRQDVRARTLSLRTPMNERTDRLYELALRYEPPADRLAFEMGRIGIYRFVGIGYLDGALVRFRPRPGLQVGAFGGRMADVDGRGLADLGGKYGAFVRLAPAGRYVRGGYDVLLAYSRENADGDVSREYLSLESSFGNGSRWSLFQRAELDLNRGWREEVTGKGYQFSNVSFSGNLRVTPSSWAFVSYDGRRNYRYYGNRIVPEEVFDDLLHQGLRAGVNIAKPGGFGASAGFGMSLKEPDPRHPELNIANAYSFNAGVRHSNLFSTGLSAGLNGSGFTNGYADGGLVSAHLGWYVGSGHMLDLSYGHSLYRVIQTEEDRTTRWLRFLGRAQLSRRFYVLGDLEYDAGDDLEGPRVFLELGVLF